MRNLALMYLLSGLFCLVLASFVLGRHERSRPRDAFLFQVFFGFIWQVGTYLVMTAPSVELATFYSRLAYSGCVFLSVATYQLVVSLLQLDNQRRYVTLGYILGTAFFFPLLLTDHLLTTVYTYPWGYWYHAGDLHPLFLVYFAAYSFFSFANLFYYSIKTVNRVERNKYRFLFCANLVLYFSIVDFFPDYGYSKLPLGFLFVSIWLFAVWFVIKLYDFFYMWKRIVRT